MFPKNVFFLFLILFKVPFYFCEHVLNNFSDDSSSINEHHSKLRDVQFSDNDTSLAVNFENVNEFQLPFYLHCKKGYKFNMEQFTEDFVHVKFINLNDTTENLNAALSLKKKNLINSTANEDDLVHYELIINSTNLFNNFCWNLTYEPNHFWYGAPSISEQYWPINLTTRIEEQPYITSLNNRTSGLVEYVWFSTSGYLIFVERNVPLFFNLDNEILCLSSKNDVHPYKVPKKNFLENSNFKAQIIVSKNIIQAFTYYLNNFVSKPKRIPDSKIYSSMFWSTLYKLKNNFNQAKIIEFANEISCFKASNLTSVIQIDNEWESSLGSLKFNQNIFFNPKSMVEEIKKLNLSILVKITPFLNKSLFEELDSEDKDLFVKELFRNNSKLSSNKYTLDFTNNRARRWFIKKIKKFLNETGIDSFNINGGDIGSFETPFKFNNPEADFLPNKYSEFFSLFIFSFENLTSIQSNVGFNSQKYGNLLILPEKESNWSKKNGLKSVIPSILSYSAFGYSFIVSNYAGGISLDKRKPSKNLYLRWLALNCFLPVIRFSYVPWDYDLYVVETSYKFLKIRSKLTNYFIELAENSKNFNIPIIRPIWWLDSSDENTWSIDTQFLVGDKYLVAPILEENHTKRTIYLPKGIWFDHLKKRNETGPTYIDNYKISLDEIAYFEKLV